MAILINGMRGLGDNIYQRSLIKRLKKVYIDTPWPELYEDLDVKFVKPKTTLRTQSKNIAKQIGRFHNYPGGEIKSVSYGSDGMIKGMEKCLGVKFKDIELPSFGDSPVDGRYAVIRPVTVRREWAAPSRNPEPKYLLEAVDELKKAGIKIVSVADIEEGEEWLVGEEPYSDVKFHKGELDVKQLLSLIEHAWVVVGGVGWIVPACIAYNTSSWIIHGGYGAFNHPDNLTHPLVNLSKQHYILPDNFCRCDRRDHNCDKKITGHRDKFRAYLASRIRNRISPAGTNEL